MKVKCIDVKSANAGAKLALDTIYEVLATEEGMILLNSGWYCMKHFEEVESEDRN